MANSEWQVAGRVRPEWDSWLRRLQAGADPFTLLEDVLEWARKHTAAQTALLLLPMQGGQEIDFVLVNGQGAEELRGLRLRPDETVLDELLHKRIPWRYYNEGEGEPHSRGVRRGFKGLHSGVGVPLPGLAGGALVLVNHRRHESFTDEDEGLLIQLAPLFTIGVHLHALKQLLEWREHERHLLCQLPEGLREELSLQRVLQVVEPVLRAASPLAGGLWLYDEERTRLLCTLRYGTPLLPELMEPTALPPGWQEAPCVMVTEQGLSVELFPLQLAGHPLGVLMVGIRDEEPGRGKPGCLPCSGVDETAQPRAMHHSPLTTLSGHIALLIGYALLHEQLARRALHLETLYEFSLRLGEARTMEEWLALLTQHAMRILPADRCVIYFAADATPQRLQPVWIAPPDDTLLNHYPDVPYSLPGWVYAFNAPLAAPDLARHPQNLKEPLPGMFCSALAVPLQTAEHALGTLLLLTTTPREFTLTEVEALFMLANFGALHLQNLGS